MIGCRRSLNRTLTDERELLWTTLSIVRYLLCWEFGLWINISRQMFWFSVVIGIHCWNSRLCACACVRVCMCFLVVHKTHIPTLTPILHYYIWYAHKDGPVLCQKGYTEFQHKIIHGLLRLTFHAIIAETSSAVAYEQLVHVFSADFPMLFYCSVLFKLR